MNYNFFKNRFVPILAAVTLLTAVSGSAQISTIAGAGGAGYGGDGGYATSAYFNTPNSIARDAAGNLYIADASNARVRKVTPSGFIYTIAGTGTSAYGGDGGPASTANLKGPTGVAVDASGNIYISDGPDARIRKVNTSGVISTFAGTGTTGFSGDGGAATAARFTNPGGLAFDTSGNLFVADRSNNRIRRITSAGFIKTVAGSGGAGSAGDGGAATTATINTPVNVTADRLGNIFIAEQTGNRIRKVNAAGTISTYAGTGTAGFSGDGSAATGAMISSPYGLAVDAGNNLYVGDMNNNRIRKVTSGGTISTYAGTGSAGFGGDGGAATAALLNAPAGVVVDNGGNLYIVDKANGRIRKIAGPNNAVVFTGGAVQSLTACSGIATALDAVMSINDADVGQTETWTVNAAPAHGALAGFTLTRTSTGAVITPTGLSYTATTGYSGADSFKIQVSDGVASVITTIRVTVNPAPDAGTISGPTAVCEAASITLSETVTGGTWSVTNAIATVSTSGVVTGLTAGIDTVKYTVTSTCGSVFASYAVTSNPLPVVPGITGSLSAAVGSTVTLANAATGGVWATSNAAVASVNTTGDVTGISVGTATISYTLTNGFGCDAYRTVNFTVTPFLAVSTIAKQGIVLHLFPNPATNIVAVNWANATSGAGTIVITNYTGAQVFKNEIDFTGGEGKKTIDVSNLPAGIYMLQLISGETSYNEKMEIIK